LVAVWQGWRRWCARSVHGNRWCRRALVFLRQRIPKRLSALSSQLFIFFSSTRGAAAAIGWLLVVVLVVDLALRYRRMRVGWRRRRMHRFWSRLPPCASEQTVSLWRLRTTVTSPWHSLTCSHSVLGAAACRSFLRRWRASRKRLLRHSPLLLLRMHGGGSPGQLGG